MGYLKNNVLKHKLSAQKRRHDIRHDNIQPNDTQRTAFSVMNLSQNNTKHNSTQHLVSLCWVSSLLVVVLSVVRIIVVVLVVAAPRNSHMKIEV